MIQCGKHRLFEGLRALRVPHNSALSLIEGVKSQPGDSRNSTLPTRENFIRCVQQTLSPNAVKPMMLPAATDAVVLEALNFWRHYFHTQNSQWQSHHAREAVALGHQTAMQLAFEQGHLHLVKMAADQYASMGLSSDTSSNLYDVIQSGCLTAKTLDLVMSVTSEMKDRGSLLDTKSWELIVSYHAQLGNVHVAVKTLHLMKSYDRIPTRKLYETVLVAVMALEDNILKAQLGEEVMQDFFTNYESLDINGFHVFLQHVSDSTQLQEILMQMKSAGVAMTPKTWSYVIDAVFRAYPFVSHWSKKFLTPSWPSVEWALELITSQTTDSAMNVGSEACEKVMVVCCQHSMLDRAMEVYNFMRKVCHTVPSPQGYMLLLREIYKSASFRNMAPAFRIWEDLVVLYDEYPPSWVYHAMLLPLAKHLKMQGVRHMRSVMISQARKEGYAPPRPLIRSTQCCHWAWSQEMYHSLIKACATAGNPEASWGFYKEMQTYWKPNQDTFANLLLTVKRQKQLERYGLPLLYEMIDNQVDNVQLLRHPFLLMCGRVRSKQAHTTVQNKQSALLISSGIHGLVHHLVDELGDSTVSVRGVLCSSIVNVLLRLVDEEAAALAGRDRNDKKRNDDDRFESSNHQSDKIDYQPYSNISNCSAKLQQLSKQFSLF